MPISIKQLRYAAAVARTGHFGRAAELCSVSQPALSQQILSLEAHCGAALFDRLKTGTMITPFGRQFIDLAQKAIEAADAVNALAAGHTGQLDRPLRFGLIPTVAPYLLPDVFPALQSQLPDLDFIISENRTDALLAGLIDGSLDIALIATELPESGPRLVSAPLFEDRFVLATSPAETVSAPISLSAVSPDRILLLDEGHCFRDQTIAACRIESDTTPRTFAATSLSTIVEFVANGQGVTLLPQIALRKEATDARIAIHQLASPDAERLLRLAWRQATPFAPTFERIAEVIRATRSPGSA
ncbi:MAG: hydrogen peroxide-inducible genes activator [Devosia sp.]